MFVSPRVNSARRRNPVSVIVDSFVGGFAATVHDQRVIKWLAGGQQRGIAAGDLVNTTETKKTHILGLVVDNRLTPRPHLAPSVTTPPLQG